MPWLEILAVLTGIIYVILAAKENILCWPFGIINAGLTVYLMAVVGLYAESILYIYYILAGIYGWWVWSGGEKINTDGNVSNITISNWRIQKHLLAFIGGSIIAFGLYYLLSTLTNAEKPLIDSFTTIFAFIATYMTTRKIIENWLYWIVIDVISVWLYADRGYYLYALLMIVYTIMAIFGYFAWKKRQNQIVSA